MSILNEVTWKSMWKNRTRTVVTVVGIILSAAMFTAVMTMVFSFLDYSIRGQIYSEGDYFLQFNYVSDDEMEQLRKHEKITQMADYQALGFLKTQPDKDGTMSTFLLAAVDENFFEMMPAHVVSGRLPQNSGEIVLPECILEVLEKYGISTAIGDTVTLELITDYENYRIPGDPPAGGGPFTESYTVVGYILENRYRDYDLSLYSMLTCADGGQGEVLWHRAFIKSEPKDAAALFEMSYGLSKSLSSEYLACCGGSLYSNYYDGLIALAVVLCGIIMAGSVSLIYNAFSISVSERTRDFGLLASVGATGRQLRGAVRAEALTLCALGIPLGLLAGYGGIAITLHLLSDRLDALISRGNGAVTLRPVLSPWALLAAAVIALFTVLISAAIPAVRASKVSPIEAIRQRKDYHAPKKHIRLGWLTQKLFGLPGAMGKKYYKVSRKKYRATVLSLVISFVLFIAAACFSQAMRTTVESAVMAQNHDIVCLTDRQDKERLRTQDFVSRSAYTAVANYMAHVPDSSLSEEMLRCWPQLKEIYDMLDKNVQDICVYYLEDAVLEAYLREQGLDPGPYLDAEDPMALVCRKRVTTHYVPDGEGGAIRYTYIYAPFSPDAQRLTLFEYGLPKELGPSEEEGEGMAVIEYMDDPGGQPLLEIKTITMGEDGYAKPDNEEIFVYRIELESDHAGSTKASYYPYDPETQTADREAAAVETYSVPSFRLGAVIDELPFGIVNNAVASHNYSCVILPMSAAPQDVVQTADLRFDVSDYRAAVSYMEEHFDEYDYVDYRSSEENERALLFVINVFAYGFIVLISGICVANVFNTISTNIALRRRDLGMLRSIGFRQKDILRMMSFECISYGIQSLFISLPISLAVSYLIHKVDSGIYSAPFVPPWKEMGIAAACVFTVVLTTMLYAVRKLRREDPINAIRAENL